MSDMDIVKLVPGTCDGIYNTGKSAWHSVHKLMLVLPPGTWSCVTAEFFVSRELTHHILQTYVPTTLIVVRRLVANGTSTFCLPFQVISWFSFWLDVEVGSGFFCSFSFPISHPCNVQAVPARVSLAITTLLTLSTQANSVKNSLPEVSYMKSLDLFLAVSVL